MLFKHAYSNIPSWKTLQYWPVFPALQPFFCSQGGGSPGDRRSGPFALRCFHGSNLKAPFIWRCIPYRKILGPCVTAYLFIAAVSSQLFSLCLVFSGEFLILVHFWIHHQRQHHLCCPSLFACLIFVEEKIAVKLVVKAVIITPLLVLRQGTAWFRYWRYLPNELTFRLSRNLQI